MEKLTAWLLLIVRFVLEVGKTSGRSREDRSIVSTSLAHVR